MACGGLGVKPEPLSIEVWSLNHWTTKESRKLLFWKALPTLPFVTKIRCHLLQEALGVSLCLHKAVETYV